MIFNITLLNPWLLEMIPDLRWTARWTSVVSHGSTATVLPFFSWMTPSFLSAGVDLAMEVGGWRMNIHD